jgi:hypothetical protein
MCFAIGRAAPSGKSGLRGDSYPNTVALEAHEPRNFSNEKLAIGLIWEIGRLEAGVQRCEHSA